MQIQANPAGMNNKELADKREQGNCRYRCVEVLPGGLDCCQAARDILGKRFLRKEIPSLPLDACDAKDCRCSYELLDDRRTGARRISDVVGNTTTLFFDSDNRQRTSSGRRFTD